ncbi:MAG TPA: 4Fe-4S dicluster domain-containing protein, partial [Atribacteraceae bacterium]|nr:4Fe-4S dicluster domain-containing protein [Atribacteraceae bacterium]
MDLVKAVKDMGVVGAGGGGFPTHLKIRSPLTMVIGNGSECEPLLSNDKYLLEYEGEKVIGGLDLVMKSTGAETGILAMKKDSAWLADRLREIIGQRDGLRLFPVDDYYPAGDEHLLVWEVAGRQIPPGDIPLSVGCLVLNVETLANVYRASQGESVTRRTLSCAGAVRQPSVVRARLGMAMQEIIELCGGPTVEDYCLVVGGPMMGTIEFDPLSPVTKTTAGLIVLPRDHSLVRKRTLPLSFIVKQSKAACCQCTYCTELCPRYLLGHPLLPHKIMRQINLGLDIPQEVIQNAFLCSECGLCEVYACPMELSPRIINQTIKRQLTQAGFQPRYSTAAGSVGETFRYRKIPSSVVRNRLQLMHYPAHPLSPVLETDPA